jgi:hypothetical protein
MSRSIPAIINNNILVWAREQVGYSIMKKRPTSLNESRRLDYLGSGAKEADNSTSGENCQTLSTFIFCFHLKGTTSSYPIGNRVQTIDRCNARKGISGASIALRDLLYRRRIALGIWEKFGEDPEPFSLQIKLSKDP